MTRARPNGGDLIDIRALEAWMDSKEIGDGPLGVLELLSGGTQNILLRFQRSGRPYVLRRPPLHPRPESNETMRREARVLAALAGTDVPHPRLISACGDETILGVSFYLMDDVDGLNPTVELAGKHRSPETQHRMGLAMMDALAALGRVDYRAAGLEGFGKPEHYLERQVARWARQFESYAQFDGWLQRGKLPHLTEVQSWLSTNQPGEFQPGVIHGDLHMGNVMFARESSKVAAIIDWELASIGDPLIDVGWVLATWPGEDEPMASIFTVRPWLGFPVPDELVERYRVGSSRDLTSIEWYKTLACYKLGIILEGTHARACAGQADPVLGARMHAAATALFARAARCIAG